jgi:hypothetical protein
MKFTLLKRGVSAYLNIRHKGEGRRRETLQRGVKLTTNRDDQDGEPGRRPCGAGLAATLMPRKRVSPLAGCHP